MNNLAVAPSPHIRSNHTTTSIMLDVIIALTPALIASVIIFGIQALIVVLACVLSCVVFEYLSRKIMKRVNTISDLSAVVTGILLAFNLPVTIPIWIAVMGSFIAIVIVKQIFGGIGQNFANPAITARIILFVSFSSHMTTWAQPFYYQNSGVDVITGATSLTLLSEPDKLPSLIDMFLGIRGGCLGETSTIALLIGGVYLVMKKVISPVTPIAFIGTVFLLSAIMDSNPIYQLMSGGLMIGAIFMATDYSTTPITQKGKMIFGLGCGLITIIIRQFGAYPEGVSFSILLMNILTPYIDKATKIRPFGGKR
ncbi:MAG: electron transport complex, RnfABCDGE type, subunit [Oscillospiraceae bacterium]|nr:electron transport complex, RnfABCDGE type, subunit [Oscillospiraceae bacterium]